MGYIVEFISFKNDMGKKKGLVARQDVILEISLSKCVSYCCFTYSKVILILDYILLFFVNRLLVVLELLIEDISMYVY